MSTHYSTDLVLIGGGITGLWLLRTLRHHGYQAILLEAADLGGAQSLASQGIIHGGLKYALSGTLSGATQAIASMPARWRQSIAGAADPDLSSVRLLSESYYMWSGGRIRSRLKSFLGSKSLRGKVEVVQPADYPELFQDYINSGTLYRLPDFVVDSRSLLSALWVPVKDRTFKINADHLEFLRNRKGEVAAVNLVHGDSRIEINGQRFVFCAGSGNKDLIGLAGLQNFDMQIRPLHMVYLMRQQLPAAYVHCIGDSFSLTPKLTITSHPTGAGQSVWYLGGELAESGIEKSALAQINDARTLLATTFPALDLSGADWQSFMIDRAEPRISGRRRPDEAFVANEHNVIVTWPTKLTLAPLMAEKVMRKLESEGIQASQQDDHEALRAVLRQPALAGNFWESNSC